MDYTKRHSIKPVSTESNKKVFDEGKFNRYAYNRLNSERYQNYLEFLNDRKKKEDMHNILISELKEKEKQYYKNLKASFSASDYDIINYNLIESSSPKYSMRGKYGIDENRENKLFIFVNNSNSNLITEPKKYVPNYDYIKSSFKSFKFGKDGRFKYNKSEKKVILLLNSHKSFNSSKSTLSNSFILVIKLSLKY